MVDPVSNFYTPYFNQETARPAPEQTAPKEVKSTSSSSGVFAFLTGDTDERKPHEKSENRKGPIGGILSGIWNGLKNTVKSLLTPQGLLMVGAFLALNFMTGGILTPLMFVLGIGVGGYQVTKGLAKGDWEGVGQGVFTLGTTVGGARFDTWSIKNKQTGDKFGMALGRGKKEGPEAATQNMPGFADNFRLVAGQKMKGVRGSEQNIYQAGRDNFLYYWQKVSGKPQEPPPEIPSSSTPNVLSPRLDQQA